MSAIELTAYPGSILGPIAKVLGWIMNGIYDIVYHLTGVESVTISIVIITILIYTCLLPLTIKQQKFSKLSQKMQPELNALREKYGNRKDQEAMMAMNEETQRIYQKYGVSPMGSCVQMLIQMPLLFALYRVFYNIPAYITSIKDYFGVLSNGKVVSGTRGRKQRTRSFDAFESMNFPELAIIRDNRIIRYYTEALPAPEDLITYDRLNDRVFVLKLTPEVKSEIFSLLFDHYDAIILETFGIGGIPAYDDSFEQAIFHWVDSGKTIAVTTQVPEEGCDLGVYQVGKKYSDHPGILQSDDMTTESIVAKLMWILGQTSEQAKISQLYYKEINHDRV